MKADELKEEVTMASKKSLACAGGARLSWTEKPLDGFRVDEGGWNR